MILVARTLPKALKSLCRSASVVVLEIPPTNTRFGTRVPYLILEPPLPEPKRERKREMSRNGAAAGPLSEVINTVAPVPTAVVVCECDGVLHLAV